jgi:hypothetical protein
MSLLRRTRAEMAGAIRSLRYDLGKHPVEPPAGGPDMTSTGMSTFGGLPVEEQSSRYVGRRPPPRKALAVSTIGVLTVAGAAGAYLAVVNGLGALVSEPAAADTFPARPTATSNAEIGEGPVTAPGRVAATTTITADGRVVTTGEAPAPRPPAGPGALVPPAPATKNTSPIRTTIPTSPECKCNPPVPTPTAPTGSPSPTPSTSSSSPAGSPSTDPAPSESSATPDESVEPSGSPQGRRHRHRH